MCRTTVRMLRLILYLALTALLASCGSGDSEDTEINLYSSTVYAEHTLAFDKLGTTLKAWGANGYGQLGIGVRLDKSSPTDVDTSLTTGYSKVSIGGAHSVAIGNDGFVYAWGHNTSGQVGDNTLTAKSKPVQVLDADGNPITGVIDVEAGGRHTLGLKADGTVLVWGSNTKGQLGDGATTTSRVAILLDNPNIVDVVAVAAGGEFSLVLKSDGTVWAWGSNPKGQLGNGSKTTSKVPVQVMKAASSPLSEIIAITAGGSHSVALDATGKIWVWGYNGLGQFGNGNTDDSSYAIETALPAGATEATSISAGLGHTLAVIDGTVYSWGLNKYGQLGNGKPLDSDLPVTEKQKVVIQDKVTLLPDIETVTAVGHHSLARGTGGTLWSWGRNVKGQLGDGTRTTRSYAKEVPGL